MRASCVKPKRFEGRGRRLRTATAAAGTAAAAGTDAASGGLVHPTYATEGGVAAVLPVDVWVPGSPPSPFALLHGILSVLDRLAPGGGQTR